MNDDFFLERLKDLQLAREINDSQAAKLLGISRQFLSSVKLGDRPMPTMLRFAILDLLGYAWTRDNLITLLPDDVADLIRAKDRLQTEVTLDSGLP